MSIETPDRDINKLSDNFKLKVIDFLKEVGDKIFITETLRTQQRQDYLYAKGRTMPGTIVTWTPTSNHQKGIAIDIAFKGDTLYPNDLEQWKQIANIAEKHGMLWGYQLWSLDKPHFEDDGKPYIPKEEVMSVEIPETKIRFGKLITVNGITYPCSIFGIPVIFSNTSSTTLVGKADIKGYTPGCTKDRILIFENTFKYGVEFLYKVILHEFSHFIYHRYIKEQYFEVINETDFKLTKLEYWERLSNNIKDYITDYAGTQPAEDFAELIGYSHYIDNNIELPDKVIFNDNVKFKYIIANNLFNTGLKEFLKGQA